ncbi:MAG: PAS domain S-box protein [Spirochaeta sp.]|jgi:PAS domain S-box-containing protein|nr:PAS domain S-box protein [Spirochaeta sp.]
MSESVKKRILLVEDEALLAMNEKMQLERYGYSVKTVTTGEKAVETVHTSPDIDLILMDIDLGAGIDGTQAAETILQVRDVPIVFLSSHTEPEIVEKTEKITSYGYVVKNSNIAVLDASIKMAFKLFESRRLADDTFTHSINGFCVHRAIRTELGKIHDCEYLRVNGAYERHTGLLSQDIIGRTIRDLYPGSEADDVIHLYDEVLSGRADARQEIYFEPTQSWYELNIFNTQEDEFTVVVHNITERKQAEDELNRFKTISDTAVYGKAISDLNGNLLYVNRFFATIHGYEPEELVGKHLSVFHNEHQLDVVHDLTTTLLRDGSFQSTKVWHCHKDGTEFPMFMNGVVLNDENGTPQYMAVSAVDMTERERLVGELRKEHELATRIIEDGPVAITQVDRDGKIVFATSYAQQLLGLAESATETLSYNSPEWHITDIDGSPFHEEQLPFRQVMSTGQAVHDVQHAISKPGTRKILSINGAPLHDEHGRIDRVVFAIEDITARTQFEHEVTSQKQYREAILETTTDGFWVVTPDKHITDVNAAYCRMSGYSADELIRMEINDLDAIENPRETAERMRRIVKNGSETFETQHRRKDGSILDVEVSASRLDREDGMYLVCFCRDISQRREMQQQLEASRKRYQTLVESSPDIIYLFGTKSGGIFWSEAVRRLLGYDPSDIVHDPFLWKQSIHPDDKPLVEMAITGAIEGEPYDIEYRIRTVHDDWVWLRDKLIDRTEQDGEIILQGHATDITKQKYQKEALEKERHRLSAIIDGTDVGTWEWNIQTGETRFNEKWAALIGYTLDEISPVSIETWERFAHPDDLRRSEQLLHAHFTGDTERYEIEARMRHKDGHWVWVLDRGKVARWTEDGKPEWIFGTHQEITERKQAEEDLHTISNMQSIILKMASDYINKSTEHVDDTINVSLQEIGEFVEADRAYVFEYDWVQDVANNTYEWCNEGVSPEIDNLQGVPNTVMEHLVEAHRNGEDISIEDVMQLPPDDGVRQVLEPQGVRSILTLPMMRQSECIGFVGFDSVRETKKYSETEKTLLRVFSEMLVNIGHRENLEKNLIHAKEQADESNADLTAIVEGTIDSIWSFDKNYNIRYINDRFRNDFHAAFGFWLEKGSNLIDALPEALRPIWKPRYDRVLSNEQFTITDEVETVSGTQFVQVSFNPIVNGDRVIGGSCFGSNITDRKIAEIEIQKQLHEKETLLREVHHRVKNNMATIESLLSLQIGSTAHAEVKSALQDTIARVQSTRVLYDKLLGSDDLNEVSIQPYANGLIDAIVRVFDLEKTITIERDIADFRMGPKKTFFLGIIINELLTNVFKYSFKDRDGGEVSVSIGTDDSTVTLSIQDNGVGFDERTLKNKSPGFGLTVVKMLVEQSGGTHSQSNDNGARSVVRFEL